MNWLGALTILRPRHGSRVSKRGEIVTSGTSSIRLEIPFNDSLGVSDSFLKSNLSLGFGPSCNHPPKKIILMITNIICSLCCPNRQPKREWIGFFKINLWLRLIKINLITSIIDNIVSKIINVSIKWISRVRESTTRFTEVQS